MTGLGQLQTWLYLEAKQGGQLLLPALATVTSTSQYLQILADGAGSKIDLSDLTSLAVQQGDLTVTNQATVLDPKLTSLTNVSVTLDGTGTMAVSQWTTLTGYQRRGHGRHDHTLLIDQYQHPQRRRVCPSRPTAPARP